MEPLEPKLIRTEVIADIPLLWGLIQRIGLTEHLSKRLPSTPRWLCPLTPAQILSIWLVFILSKSDHRLNQVIAWVARYRHVLCVLLKCSQFTKPPKAPNDDLFLNAFTDDRLAFLLSELSAGDVFALLESDLNQNIIRVYQLDSPFVRIDTTTANSYSEIVSKDGILQFGYSKDDPSRPQIKVAIAALDPLGMPLTTAIVPGHKADEPLYKPAIQKVQQSLGTGKRTFVGDSKMGILETRCFVDRSGEYSLCPLALNQFSQSNRDQKRLELTQTGQLQILREPTDDPNELGEVIAQGYCYEEELEYQGHRWQERRWFVRSSQFADKQIEHLEERLTEAAEQFEHLNKRKKGKKILNEQELREKAEQIIKSQRLEGMLSYSIKLESRSKPSGGKRKPVEVQEAKVSWLRNEEAIKQAKEEMGWRVYAENHKGLTLNEVVQTYRGQYRLEKGWSRLKGSALSLTPMYLQDENRIVGLVMLLSLCLRVLTLVEWGVRKKLADKNEKPLQKIYKGQDSRKTRTPSAELLLETMDHISITVMKINGRYHVFLSELSETQRRLLELWDLGENFYQNIVDQLQQTLQNSSEPYYSHIKNYFIPQS